VPLLLAGKFDKEAKKKEMRSKGKSEEEVADWDALATEIIQAINSKQLVPTMRSQYMRTAFQLNNDASVRKEKDRWGRRRVGGWEGGGRDGWRVVAWRKIGIHSQRINRQI
jgi:hypothetical protein